MISTVKARVNTGFASEGQLHQRLLGQTRFGLLWWSSEKYVQPVYLQLVFYFCDSLILTLVASE